MAPGTKKICGVVTSCLLRPGDGRESKPGTLARDRTADTFGEIGSGYGSSVLGASTATLPVSVKPSYASGLAVSRFGQEMERSWTNISNVTGYAPCFDERSEDRCAHPLKNLHRILYKE